MSFPWGAKGALEIISKVGSVETDLGRTKTTTQLGSTEAKLN